MNVFLNAATAASRMKDSKSLSIIHHRINQLQTRKVAADKSFERKTFFIFCVSLPFV